MKRICFLPEKPKHAVLLFVLLFCFLPLTAGAYSITDEASFNKLCKWRMKTDATLYERINQSDENGIEKGWVFEPIGTLAAGKWVSSLAEMDGKYHIFYWNGGRRDAYVDAGTFTGHIRTITSTTGKKYNVSSLAWGDDEVVRYVISEFYSQTEVQQFIDGMHREMKGLDPVTGTEKVNKGSGSSSGKKKASPTPIPLEKPVIIWKQEGKSQPVEVKQAGVGQCIVLVNGKEETAATTQLFLENEETAVSLARVFAPRTGKATLYARENGKGGALKKLDAGTVLLVLEKGEKYTRVYAGQTTGFVLTDALQTEAARETWETAETRSSVNFRLENKKDGHRMRVLKKGTEVTLFSRRGEWAEIEVNGQKGYVMTKFLEP